MPSHRPIARERLLLVLAGVFLAVNATALWLTSGEKPLLQLAVWLIAASAAHLLLAHHKPQHDPYLLPLFALFGGWGLLLQSRLAPNFAARQALWFFLGTMALVAVTILPKTLAPIRAYRYTLLIFGIILMAFTLLFGVNPSGAGAAYWLPIPLFGGVYFQPSELLKLLMVFFFAGFFADRGLSLAKASRSGWRQVLPWLAPLALMWGFAVGMLIWQRDLGAATLFFSLFVSQLYLATGDRRYIIAAVGMLLIAGFAGYQLYDVVTLRVDAWWNPWPDADGRAYQIVQSLYATAAGGVGGSGINQGFPDYIPVVHSDFAFAAIVEEWGLVGGLATVAGFALLAQRGLRLAAHTTSRFHTYIAAGITVILSTQTLLIMGGVTRLLPLTGVTLPFVSYGGSSMLIGALMVGLLLYLSTPSPR